MQLLVLVGHRHRDRNTDRQTQDRHPKCFNSKKRSSACIPSVLFCASESRSRGKLNNRISHGKSDVFVVTCVC